MPWIVYYTVSEGLYRRESDITTLDSTYGELSVNSTQNETSVIKAMLERRSVRHFSEATVDRGLIWEALKAASWAPSGLNNQPWRFALLWDQSLKDKVAALTRYSTTLKSAQLLIPVFLDKDGSYDRVKDCQAVGACIQNLLLALHSLELGAVWVGEILKNKEKVLDVLGLPDRLELMAVVAVGYPAHRDQTSHRKPLEELVVLER